MLSVMPARFAMNNEVDVGAIAQQILIFVGGVVAALLGFLGISRNARSQTEQKRVEASSARDMRFVDMGEHLIDNLSIQVKELQDKHDGHSEQILSLYKELHTYKMQCSELTDKVTLQTLKIQEQDLKLTEQAVTIEGLRRDNAALQAVNRELMAQVRSDMQVNYALKEAVADNNAVQNVHIVNSETDPVPVKPAP